MTAATAASPREFTADDYASRITRVVEQALEAGLDAVVVAPGPDLVWLTGYQPTAITEWLTILVLAPGMPPTLLVPVLKQPDAVAAVGASALEMRDWTDGTDPYQAAFATMQSDGRFGISDAAWSAHVLGLQRVLPGSRWQSLGECLPMLRADKGADEIERLTAAGAAADAIFLEIVELAFEGRLETEVAADLARLLREHGHERVDFTVVGSGPDGANPHHEAGYRRIQHGDTVVLDFGGLMYGYGSDTTRTVTLGEPTQEVRDVHDIVRRAQQSAFEAVRQEVPCQEIDRVARAVITEAGYREQFIHRTGHGIGVTTHEPPYMVESEMRPRRPGMRFSIEPGIYLSGRFGVRIEDIVAVTDTGGRRLNSTDGHLRIVN
jgi:D-alanyl-D-alanine dipeptidase